MTPWAAQGQRLNQQIYGNYPMPAGSYPNATGSSSPMNYGGYYPPTTYSVSSAYGATTSGPAYRGGYPSTTGAGSGQSTTTTAGPPYNQYASSYYKTPTSIAVMGGTNGGTGNGYTATSGPSYNGGYDPALMAAMQNMSFGNSK
jgi:aryl-phospho-beta-D-glucosidase BglC (GH1 family)